jgi:hypothetical protein
VGVALGFRYMISGAMARLPDARRPTTQCSTMDLEDRIALQAISTYGR